MVEMDTRVTVIRIERKKEKKHKKEQSWRLPINCDLWKPPPPAPQKTHQILPKQYEIPQLKAIFSGLRSCSL